MSEANEDYWPEFIYEREPTSDVERIEDGFKAQGIKVKSKFEGEITAELSSGERLKLHWQEVEVEMGERGLATILVEGEPVWSGQISEIEHLHTYSSAIDKTLCGVAVNGKVVWVRLES